MIVSNNQLRVNCYSSKYTDINPEISINLIKMHLNSFKTDKNADKRGRTVVVDFNQKITGCIDEQCVDEHQSS